MNSLEKHEKHDPYRDGEVQRVLSSFRVSITSRRTKTQMMITQYLSQSANDGARRFFMQPVDLGGVARTETHESSVSGSVKDDKRQGRESGRRSAEKSAPLKRWL